MTASTWRRLLPRASDYRHPGSRLHVDLLAGVTVAIVALPLALAFGVTAGLGARAGIITAITAGIVAGVFGGSDVQVSGPTGAMTVVLVPVVARHGADAVLAIGLMAGFVLIAAAAFRLGRLLAYIPWPVVEGFTVGIAVIILLQQIPAMLGIPRPPGENAAAVAARAVARAASAEPGALVAAGTAIAIMLLLPRLGRALPTSLVAVAVATLVAHASGFHVPTIGEIPSTFPSPHLPNLSGTTIRDLLSPTFAVAALAAIESLLSAKVSDGMSDGREHDPDRELFGQGLANLVSPLFGGMPATGAIARTAVNVRAGARTRISAITHGIILIAAILSLGWVLRLVPLAALGGVLAVVASRMVDVRAMKMLMRSTRGDAAVLAMTTLATIVFDLVVAIEIGIVVAGALALRAVAKTTSFEPERVSAVIVTPGDEERLLHDHIVAYRLDGALFFGAAQRFLTKLAAVADVRVVILRLDNLQVLDATGAHALGDIAEELEGRGISVLFAGARPSHGRLMRVVGALDSLAHEQHVFGALDEAIEHARAHAARMSQRRVLLDPDLGALPRA